MKAYKSRFMIPRVPRLSSYHPYYLFFWSRNAHLGAHLATTVVIVANKVSRALEMIVQELKAVTKRGQESIRAHEEQQHDL